MPRFGRLLTAMVTPFDDDGALDLDGARRIARHLTTHGNEGIVVAGTTGESPTLTHDETLALFRAVVEEVGQHATVLAGCGKNDTAATVRLVEEASATGVDGVMLVSPYYNRPSQDGLYAHFGTAAAATELPVLLYDIPKRTGCGIAAETTLRLAEKLPNIAAVKDASGDFAKAAWLMARAPDGFDLYSGDDAATLPLLSLGGVGLVSVAAHVVGDDLAAMIEAFPTAPGKALDIHRRLAALFGLLFREPSPGPVKAALDLMGLPAGGTRLPMTPASPALRVELAAALADLGIRTVSAPA